MDGFPLHSRVYGLTFYNSNQEFEAAFPEINTDLIIQTLETVYKSSRYAAAMESLVTQLRLILI